MVFGTELVSREKRSEAGFWVVLCINMELVLCTRLKGKEITHHERWRYVSFSPDMSFAIVILLYTSLYR